MEKFDQAYEEGLISGILTTNLIYQTPELLSRPYYINCDMSKYIALVIDTLNHDASISSILDPSERIQQCSEKYKKGEAIELIYTSEIFPLYDKKILLEYHFLISKQYFLLLNVNL